jgi:hypothetical protein
MAAETDIINAGLILLGELPIVSTSDNRKAARLSGSRYPQIRDAVLRAHPWNCATKRATESAAASPAPAWGWTNAFNMPADFLRLIRLRDHRQDYAYENKQILVDTASVQFAYVYRLTDVNKMDALLRESIASRLAAVLALPLAKSGTLRRELWKGYDDTLAEARTINAQENPTQEFMADEWDNARFIGVAGPFRPIESA